MFENSARLLLVLGLTSLISLPSYARGFGGGGGFDRGGFGSGGRGGGRDFGGGFDRGGAGHQFGGGSLGGHETHPDFGGGFSGAGGDKPIVSNHPNFSGGENGFGHGRQVPNRSDFPTDGGFGNLSGNRVPHNFDGNTVNKNEFNHTNVNNINAYGYHGNGYGGYHPYGGYGYHGYGWNAYNPTAMMWSYAGISSLTTLTAFLGMSAIMGASGGSKKQPASYSNVTYNNGNVYIDGQAAGSSSDFYKQAQQLAATAYNAPYAKGSEPISSASYPGLGAAGAGAPAMAIASGSQNPNQGRVAIGQAQAMAAANDGDWKPLGTFSLAEAGQTQSNMMLQLEINKDGILHGTYFNQLTMETSKVYGALDKATQRISWTIGTNPSTVFDAGLGDMLKDKSAVLVHYSPSNSQKMALIRLQHPPAGVPPQA